MSPPTVCNARPRLGDKAPIRQMQGLLNQMGGYNIPEDGDFGSNTEKTVRDWQTKNHIIVDGVVGGQTWPTLCTPVCQTCPTLQRGSPNYSDVKKFQALLNKTGGYNIPEDGDFGANTEKTVRDWQTKNHIIVDGVVGGQTWPTLCTPVCQTCPTLQRGSPNYSDVKKFQALLNKTGGYNIPEDGDFGANTEKTVRDWQTKNHIIVDGVVGGQTWPTLCTSVCETRPTLQRGSPHYSDVKKFQALLNKTGGYNIPEDGDFGANTEKTVRDWQTKKHIIVDGVVGGQTWPTLCTSVCMTRPRLQKGASNYSDVRQLQELLNKKGYNISVDGDFGAHTEKAVKDWQGKNGRMVDGIVGDQTWLILCGSVCSFQPILGDKTAIRGLQSLLNDVGGYSIPEDGFFGSNTERTVKDWQSKNGLTVDGIVGPQTWSTLCPARNRIIPATHANKLLQSPFRPFYIDVRPPQEFAAGHGPTATNIPVYIDGIIPTFADDVRQVASEDTTLLLSCKGGKASAMAAGILSEAGFTDLTQIEGGFIAWKATVPALPISRIIPPTEAYELLESPNPPFYIDVRPPPEYAAGHGPTAVNVPVYINGIVPTFVQDVLRHVSEDTTLLLSCKGGKASAMAAGILEKAGFADLTQIEGGFNAWLATEPKLPVET